MFQDKYLKDLLFRENGFSYVMYNFRKLVKNTEFKTALQLSVYTWEVFSVLELGPGIPPKHTFWHSSYISHKH